MSDTGLCFWNFDFNFTYVDFLGRSMGQTLQKTFISFFCNDCVISIKFGPQFQQKRLSINRIQMLIIIFNYLITYDNIWSKIKWWFQGLWKESLNKDSQQYEQSRLTLNHWTKINLITYADEAGLNWRIGSLLSSSW